MRLWAIGRAEKGDGDAREGYLCHYPLWLGARAILYISGAHSSWCLCGQPSLLHNCCITASIVEEGDSIGGGRGPCERVHRWRQYLFCLSEVGLHKKKSACLDFPRVLCGARGSTMVGKGCVTSASDIGAIVTLSNCSPNYYIVSTTQTHSVCVGHLFSFWSVTLYISISPFVKTTVCLVLFYKSYSRTRIQKIIRPRPM